MSLLYKKQVSCFCVGVNMKMILVKFKVDMHVLVVLILTSTLTHWTITINNISYNMIDDFF